MYGITTLAPSINFPVDGFDFLLGFVLLRELCWVVVILKDFVKVIYLFCKKLSAEHSCLALWMRVWNTYNFAVMG